MKNIVIAFAFTAICIAGCRSSQVSEGSGRSFGIYIESWEHISFETPRITEGQYSKMHSKAEAEDVIEAHRRKMLPSADVMLGKNLNINNKGFESEIDEIQEWLVSQGIKNITFKLAMSGSMPPVVREYKNGKIIKAQQGASADAKRPRR